MLNKISVLFFVSLLSASAFAGPMVEISSKEELNSYIVKSKFNGVVLVAKDKNILMKEAFGYKNLESKIPLTTSDKFQIGSNTKQFIAASLLKLQEEGRVSLDDSITKYLPELSEYKNIKVRDILNHTSGISNYTDHEEFWSMLDYNKTLTLDEIINFTSKFPLEFETKTKWNYSNSGYIIAGKILEIVSGQTWDEFLEENFLKPLDMKDTGYQEYFEKISDVTGNVLQNDKLVPFTDLNLSWALSAGALYSTVDDLLKWTSIYEKSSIISDSSRKEMQTPFLKNYGLGLWIQPYNDDVLIKHGGRTPGFVSNIDFLRNSKLKVITLDNIDGKTSDVAGILVDFYSNGKALAIKTDSYPLQVESFQEYEGEFASGKFEVKVFVNGNKLFLQPNDGQPAYLMIPNDKDSFNLQFISGEEFIRNAKGTIIALKHYQNNHVSSFIKKNSAQSNGLNLKHYKIQKSFIFKEQIERYQLNLRN